MNFNQHYIKDGEHAFLSPSKYHWINYDDEKLIQVFKKHQRTQRGVELHALARMCIEHGVKVQQLKRALNNYINDAIRFRMIPEQVLYYTDNVFGTADAISFRDGMLRIHDLKTGASTVSVHQLEVYAALFCLEYKFDPKAINMELRIYQEDMDLIKHEPNPEDIAYIMEKIKRFDRLIEKAKLEDPYE